MGNINSGQVEGYFISWLHPDYSRIKLKLGCLNIKNFIPGNSLESRQWKEDDNECAEQDH